MSVEIYSPSYMRAGKTPLTKWLPEVWLCVSEAEAEGYRRAHSRVIAMPVEAQGNVARARNWIMDRARSEGVKAYLIMDDDIRACRRWVSYSKTMKFSAEKFREFIQQGFLLCREWECHLWGVNADTGKGAFMENTPFSLRGFISAAMHGHNNPTCRYDERISLKEDYDFCLQELNKTRRIFRINRAHLIKSDHKTRGGCASYRTTVLEAAHFEALEKKWGAEIVRRDNGKVRTHRKKTGLLLDINPIIRAPIGGV